MRQLGLGLVSYATGNNGRLPGTQHFQQFGSRESWIYTIRDYLGGEIEDIRTCPADPKGPERARNDASSYILNNYLDSGAVDIFGSPLPGRGNIRTISDPSRTIMLFIIAESKGAGPGNDHIHGSGWRTWPRVLADIQPDRHRRGAAAPDHSKGSANYLYADGHVQSIPAAEMKRRTESGQNIALPPK
jgi:prepilin-type processing-associated H-X9-DG protein